MFGGKADAIFVFAGRESRKRFGVRLFREGLASRLVLSVGRFEWRRFPSLGLPDDGGLAARVAGTEPWLRHFFVDVRSGSARCEKIDFGGFGTFGTWRETRALAAFVRREGIRELFVVSHRQHLIRCVLGLSLIVPESCSLIPVAAPAAEREPPPDRMREALKLLSYGAFLSPLWVRRGLLSGLRRRPIPGIKSRFTLSQPGLREGDFRKPNVAAGLPPAEAAADGRTHD
ncbi:MAG TPA: hypothetical protein VJ921_13545 [Vicinamibacteria bacterium]|nr:hypothetical protein [Vicinamibacteria bacterium]